MGFSLELFIQQLELFLSMDQPPEVILAEIKNEVTKSKTYAIECGAMKKDKVPTYLSDAWFNPFYIFDTETTGFAGNDEVLQLGVVDFDGEVLIDKFVSTDKEIHPDAAKVNGITKEIIDEKGEPWADTWEGFCKATTDNVVIAWNIDYDLRLLEQTCVAHNADFSLFQPLHTLCAMKEYASLMNIPRGREKLITAAEQQDVTVMDAHQAIGDCMMVYGILSTIWDEQLKD